MLPVAREILLDFAALYRILSGELGVRKMLCAVLLLENVVISFLFSCSAAPSQQKVCNCVCKRRLFIYGAESNRCL